MDVGIINRYNRYMKIIFYFLISIFFSMSVQSGIYHDPNGIKLSDLFGDDFNKWKNIEDDKIKKEVLMIKLVKSCDFTDKKYLSTLNKFGLCKNTKNPIYLDFDIKFIKNPDGLYTHAIAGPIDQLDDIVAPYLGKKTKKSEETIKIAKKLAENRVLRDKKLINGAEEIINEYTEKLLAFLSQMNISNYKEFDFSKGIIDILGIAGPNSYVAKTSKYCEENDMIKACTKYFDDSIALFPTNGDLTQEFKNLYNAKYKKLNEMNKEKKSKEKTIIIFNDYFPSYQSKYSKSNDLGWCEGGYKNQYYWGKCGNALSNIEKWRKQKKIKAENNPKKKCTLRVGGSYCYYE